MSYKWNFGDSSTGTGKIVTHTYSKAGQFTVKLTVTDNDGKSISTSKTVTVVKPQADARIEKAVDWALSWVGSDPPLYRGFCLRFVWHAYEKGANAKFRWSRPESAKECANKLKAEGEMHSSGLPPRGSWVFYNWYGTIGGVYKNWGHVGLSLGNGYIVHALLGHGVIKSRYLEYTLDGYIGWAWPPVKPPIQTSGLSVMATCPVDLVVIDPDGLVITKEFGEISEAIYLEEDFNDDGSLDDYVYIPEQKIGEYLITVVPEPDADPAATYTLEVSTGDATFLLAENVPISDIPEEPYALDSTTFDTPPVTLLTIGEPQYTDSLNNIYVSSETSFNLTAEDNLGGSGVMATSYKIYNYTYSTDWLTYEEPFNLTQFIDGLYFIDFNSTDYAGNVEPTNTDTVILDNTGPLVAVMNPPSGWALQDVVTFVVSAIDVGSGVSSVSFSIREVNGSEGTPVGFEDLAATYNATTGKWTVFFDTLQLPDGYYIVLASAEDNLGNIGSTTVPYSIRNWAVIELLPASKINEAGRTMPVKFSLRVAASVDPEQPFVYNEDLTIKIYATDNPSNILQTSTFGETSRDYRVNTLSEQYITNFQTLKTPKTYMVEIWRKNMLIGSFQFKTVK